MKLVAPLLVLSLMLVPGFKAVFANMVETKVETTENQDGWKLLRFNSQNKKSYPLYCRQIVLPNVVYQSNGEFFDSLVASVENKSFKANQNKSFVQDVSLELKDLLQLDSSLTPVYSEDEVVADCEKQESRLTKITVIDDLRSCGGQEIEQKTFLVDFGNGQLSRADRSDYIPYKTGDYIFKNLHAKSLAKISNGRLEIFEMPVDGNISKKSSSVIDPDLGTLIGAQWVTSKQILVFFINGLKLNLIEYLVEGNGIFTGNSIELPLASMFTEVSQSDLNSTPSFLPRPTVEDIEISNEYVRHLKNNQDEIAKSLSFYYRYVPGFNKLQFIMGYRLPLNTVYSTKWDASSKIWKEKELKVFSTTGSTSKFFTFVSVDVNGDMKLENKTPITFNVFKRYVNTGDFEHGGYQINKLRYKDFKFSLENDGKVRYLFGEKSAELNGLCRPLAFYHDLFRTAHDFEINSLLHGTTLLIQAHKTRNYERTLDLLAKGADPNMTDTLGNTSLHFAVGQFDKRFVVNLLAYNANVNVQNRYGETPLISEVRTKLNGVDNLETEKRREVIQSAVEIISLLLKAGADSNLKDRTGKSALDYATELGHPEVFNTNSIMETQLL